MKKQKMDICRKTGYFKGNKFILVQLTNSSYSMLYVCAGVSFDNEEDFQYIIPQAL